MYKAFLEILNMYRKGQKSIGSVYEEVCVCVGSVCIGSLTWLWEPSVNPLGEAGVWAGAVGAGTPGACEGLLLHEEPAVRSTGALSKQYPPNLCSPQVALLFRNHDDLLREFTYFLPDNTPPVRTWGWNEGASAW